MNICFFTISRLNPLTGGVERVTYNLARYFISKGFNVFYFNLQGVEDDKHFVLPNTKDKNVISRYIDEKIQKYEIDIIIDQYGFGRYMSHEYLKSNVKLVRCLHMDVEEKYITLCLLETFSFKRLKRSIIDFLFWLNTPLRRIKMNKEYDYVIRYTDKFVLLSNSYVEKLSERKYSHKKLFAINNATIVNDESNAEKKENIILFCGRIIHNHKNILFVLYLWRKLYMKYPDWKMVLVGDGEDRDIAEKLISKYKLPRVQITGYVDPEPYYKRSKILVFPSYREGFSMVLLEAMSFGCVPVVFDTCSAFKDVVTNGENGFIVKAIDKDKYIERTMALMDNEDLLSKLAENAMNSVRQKFNLDVIGNKWIELFNELVSNDVSER